MNRAVISLGSNVADKKNILYNTMSHLGVTVIEATPPYIDVQDNVAQDPYINIVAVIESPVDHNTLQRYFKQLERDAGRCSGDKATGLVPLDIDIVLFNGDIIRPADFSRAYFKHGYSLLKTKP